MRSAFVDNAVAKQSVEHFGNRASICGLFKAAVAMMGDMKIQRSIEFRILHATSGGRYLIVSVAAFEVLQDDGYRSRAIIKLD